MDAITFNKTITEYINTLTPGAMFYAPLIEILKEPEIKKEVPVEKIRDYEEKVKMFNVLKDYDRLFVDGMLEKLDHACTIQRSLLLDVSYGMDKLESELSALLGDIQNKLPIVNTQLLKLRGNQGDEYQK